MSVMDSLKKPIGGKNKDKAAPSGELVLAGGTPAAAPAPEQKPSKAAKGAAPVLSASPRANLLPPEIGQNQRKRTVRRSLLIAVILVLVLVLAGVGGSIAFALSAGLALGTEQLRTDSLRAEQQTYAEVKATQAGIVEGEAAVRVAGGTDIDWTGYLAKLQSALPSDVQLTIVAIDSADAVQPYTQSTVPGEGPRIATITFTAETAVLPSIPSWIDGLSGMPGFVDATPSSLKLAEGVYSATVLMHINDEAYSHRYDPATDEEDGE